MPLLDHFRPPLAPRRRWDGFFVVWAAKITGSLNIDVLPQSYVAAIRVHLGGQVEAEAGTSVEEDQARFDVRGADSKTGGHVWTPAEPRSAIPTVFPDEFEVLVYGEGGGPHLVAAVVLVSPGNKDRPETRRAFAARCSGYLQRGIGLVVIDIATERKFNLHDELMRAMGREGFDFPGEGPLYTVSYRPARRTDGDQIDYWPTPLAVGESLPVVPLPLLDGPTLPLDLEATYNEARRASRL